MQILLEKPELENFIRSQVDGGEFSSPTAVVEAALVQFMSDGFAPEELDRLAAEGEDSLAKYGPLKAEDVFRELEEMS